MATRSFTTPAGRATRDRIIEVAMQAFAARGFRNTSIDAIAAEVGVSRQAVLYHFATKVDLLVAVLEEHDRANGAYLRELFERHDGVIEATMRAYVQANVHSRGLIRLFLVVAAESIDADHPFHDHFVERYRRMRAEMAKWIDREQAAGRLSDALPPDRLAAVAIAILDGLQLQEYLDEGSLDIEQILADLFALFVR